MQATGSGQEEAGCERGRRKESFLGLPVPIRRVFFLGDQCTDIRTLDTE